MQQEGLVSIPRLILPLEIMGTALVGAATWDHINGQGPIGPAPHWLQQAGELIPPGPAPCRGSTVELLALVAEAHMSQPQSMNVRDLTPPPVCCEVVQVGRRGPLFPHPSPPEAVRRADPGVMRADELVPPLI